MLHMKGDPKLTATYCSKNLIYCAAKLVQNNILFKLKLLEKNFFISTKYKPVYQCFYGNQCVIEQEKEY